MKRLGSGDLQFISPKGRRIHEVPTAPAMSNDAASVLIERLLEDGIQIEPMDNLPTWDGRPIDLNTTVQYLLSTRTRPSATGGSAETPVL